ncbi:MAG: P-type conjugative transfer protein VirB9 [Methylomicrobium sp.]|nr:P-type conjugative transfer protein VirB9 [Methylomicrobium sp.]
MKMTRLAIAVFMTVSTAAYAADLPQGSQYDNRIQYVNYNEGDVVIIRSLPGLGNRIVFAPDEKILDVASGFTQGWEFSDRRNILFIKPKSIKSSQGQESVIMAPEPGKWDTNLMVTTTRRLYDFDLKLLPGGGNNGKAPQNYRVAYRVEFRYPDDELAKAKEAAAKKAAEAKLDRHPAPRNWSYSMQIGDASDGIAPTMAYDDGRFTYLKFPNNRDFPAVFIVAADKTESLVNSHVDNDVLVIHRVASEMVLRLGNAVVGIYNDQYDADGIPPNDGTTVPGVQRVSLGGDEL